METNDLEVLLRSRVPIVVVDSRDEGVVTQTLARACAQQSAPASLPRSAAAGGGMTTLSGAPVVAARPGLPLFQWTVTDGLKRLDIEVGPPQRTLARAGRCPQAHPRHHPRRGLRAARLPSLPERPDHRAAAQGYRAGLRALRAYRRADRLRHRDPARARAPERARCLGAAGPRRASPAGRGGGAAVDARQSAPGRQGRPAALWSCWSRT